MVASRVTVYPHLCKRVCVLQCDAMHAVAAASMQCRRVDDALCKRTPLHWGESAAAAGPIESHRIETYAIITESVRVFVRVCVCLVNSIMRLTEWVSGNEISAVCLRFAPVDSNRLVLVD